MAESFQISGRQFGLDGRGVARAASRELPEPVRDHYVVIAGRRYPPKQVIALATGLDRADFTTHQARRILRRLGFPAARRSRAPAPPRGSAPSSDPAFDRAERLRPYIGQWVAVKGEEVLVGARTAADVVAWLSRYDIEADSMFRVPEGDAAAGGAAPS